MTTLHTVTFKDGTTSRVGTAWLTRWPEDIVEVDGKPFPASPDEDTAPTDGQTVPEGQEPEHGAAELADATPAPEAGDTTEAAEAAQTPTQGRKRGTR